jgi:hypothetical protein
VHAISAKCEQVAALAFLEEAEKRLITLSRTRSNILSVGPAVIQ